MFFKSSVLCVYITYIALERMRKWVAVGRWGAAGWRARYLEGWVVFKTNVNQCCRTTQPAIFTGAFIYTRILDTLLITPRVSQTQSLSLSLSFLQPLRGHTKNFPSRSIKRGLGEKLAPRDTCSVNRYALNMNVHDSRLNTWKCFCVLSFWIPNAERLKFWLRTIRSSLFNAVWRGDRGLVDIYGCSSVFEEVGSGVLLVYGNTDNAVVLQNKSLLG